MEKITCKGMNDLEPKSFISSQIEDWQHWERAFQV